jgi:hypothetical protein
MPFPLTTMPLLSQLALLQVVLVAEIEELFNGLGNPVVDRILVEELVAGAAAGDQVSEIIDPLARVAEALDRPDRDYVINRNVEPDLVRLVKLSIAVDAGSPALIEDVEAVTVATGAVA